MNDRLKLKLSETKTLITTPREKPAIFLGTQISISSHYSFTPGVHGQKQKVVSQIVMNAPMDRIIRKLASVKMMDPVSKVGTPRFLWLAEDKDTIITLYNSILRGYLNYYSFANNRHRVASSLEFILRTSCAKLLAAKFSLKTLSQVLRRFGDNLKGEDKVAFVKPSYKIDVWDFKINVQTSLKTLYASRISKASLENLVCVKVRCSSGDAPHSETQRFKSKAVGNR